jgi:hypothetical protein
MQNVLSIVRGERPWQPQPAVLTGQVLDRHGHPRVGLLHHDNRVVLYRQLEAPGAERVWAYVTVRPAEVWALQDALGPVAFNRVLERRQVTGGAAAETSGLTNTPHVAGRSGGQAVGRPQRVRPIGARPASEFLLNRPQ